MSAIWNCFNTPQKDFIEIMPDNLIDRIKSTGIQLKDVIFLKIPYLAKSAVNSSIVGDYKHHIYYKSFIATEGILKNLTDVELKIVIAHEADELKDLEKLKRKDMTKAFSTPEEEENRHGPLIVKLYNTYGKESVEKTLKKVTSLSNSYSDSLITRNMLLFWLLYHLLINYDKYKQYGSQMTQEMLTPNALNKVISVLNEAYNKDSPPPDIFRELLLSITNIK